MGREGKVNRRRGFRRRVRSEDRGSDDSDEDYVIEDEMVVSDEDDFEEMEDCLDEDASEESFGGSVEEDDVVEELEDGFRKIVKSRRRRGRKAGGKTSRKRDRVYFEEEEGEDDEDYVVDEEEEYVDENDDDDDDDEFTLEEVDDLVDEDEDCMVKKKKYNVMVSNGSVQKRGSVKGQRSKRRRKSRVSKNPPGLKLRNHGSLNKEEVFKPDDVDDIDFLDKVLVNRKKRTTSGLKARRMRTYVVDSDSDFVSSRSSDDDYTISEEEREQAKKGSKLFGNLKKILRSSTSTNGMQENGVTCQQKNNLGRKGKEKVKEIKEEVVKQVCGICLSEEDKRRSRGTLDCCSHFFCFTCIMEWSKVESRCPLCKQRFKTITKNGRSTDDLRNGVIEVPERDQVYQPTEEEIRSAIDPYESVICSECHEGGDDGLMLLCDLCDSPAHTYCVGLGQQVPEGNWYCDGCRPVALGSSSTQAEDPRMTGNDTFDRTPPLLSNMVERSGAVIDSSPRLAFSQVFGNMSSPRFPTRDMQAASPVSGMGAPTLSMRRQLHRRIQNIISMNFMAGRMDGVSASNLQSELLNSRIGQDRETIIRNSTSHEIGLLQNMLLGERSLANSHSSTSIHDMSPSQFREQTVWNPTSTTPNNRPVNLVWCPGWQGTNALHVNEPLQPYNGTSCPELQGTTALPVNEQLHPSNGRSSMGSDVNFSFRGVGEQNGFYALKEQLQSMVKTHLRNLSQDTDLGHDTYKEIVRSSTHTILAACGLEHRRSEVQHVPPPSTCIHADRLGEMSMMKDVCSSCFDSFVRDVVKRILNTRLSQWLSLGL